jgi:hypothetical protein
MRTQAEIDRRGATLIAPECAEGADGRKAFPRDVQAGPVERGDVRRFAAVDAGEQRVQRGDVRRIVRRIATAGDRVDGRSRRIGESRNDARTRLDRVRGESIEPVARDLRTRLQQHDVAVRVRGDRPVDARCGIPFARTFERDPRVGRRQAGITVGVHHHLHRERGRIARREHALDAAANGRGIASGRNDDVDGSPRRSHHTAAGTRDIGRIIRASARPADGRPPAFPDRYEQRGCANEVPRRRK